MLFANRLILLFFLLSLVSCSDVPQKNAENISADFYTQDGSNRAAAEWEPAIGTMIVWPLCIPSKLAIELAKDHHLFTLVENEASKEQAMHWYQQWGIDPGSNTFIITPQGVDSWWVRDWGPAAVFNPGGQMKLADGKYIYSTPVSGLACDDSLSFLYNTPDNKIIETVTDDTATQYLGRGLQMEILDLPFVSTGGNVLTDGLGSAFSTCIIVNENRFFNVPKEKFLQLNKELLGIDRYHILSNFEMGGIQHIDCYLKLLDAERILVAEPPRDHELYPVYERIIENEIKKLKTPYGRPYEIVRISTGRYEGESLAAYTNALIVNRTIYVPLFNIKEDSTAINTWQTLMPGHTVKGFTFDLAAEPFITPKLKTHYKEGYGWKSGDALHCRVRAVWDPQMLFIAAKKINKVVDTKNKNIVYCTVIDYSRKGLDREKNKLAWRVAGEKEWQPVQLEQIEKTDHYFAEIPFHEAGKTIEYFISAASRSGKKETFPRTAPLGTYQFTIQ